MSETKEPESAPTAQAAENPVDQQDFVEDQEVGLSLIFQVYLFFAFSS